MANDLQTTTANPVTSLATLITPLINSALVGDTWQAEWGRRVFDRERIDTAPLIAAHEAALAPVDADWLTERLKIMWKSMPKSGALEAAPWLHETVRLLRDIPHDLVAHAIDEAIRHSDRGFMPGASEIRAHAEPQLKRRKLHLWRLKEIERLKPEPPLEPEARCTPEEAERIRKAAGIKFDDDGATKRDNWIPVEERTAPDRAWYLAHGVAPEDCPPEPVSTPSQTMAA